MDGLHVVEVKVEKDGLTVIHVGKIQRQELRNVNHVVVNPVRKEPNIQRAVQHHHNVTKREPVRKKVQVQFLGKRKRMNQLTNQLLSS
jgi:hypothetical protein